MILYVFNMQEFVDACAHHSNFVRFCYLKQNKRKKQNLNFLYFQRETSGFHRILS